MPLKLKVRILIKTVLQILVIGQHLMEKIYYWKQISLELMKIYIIK